jgi:hypothetical protein
MTVRQLHILLELAIKQGHEEAPIYFDTEAKEFKYHMAKVGAAYTEEDLMGPGQTWIILYEERK